MANSPVIMTEEKYSLDAKVDFLKRSSAYPNTAKVEAVETHMSWVFLTGQFAYKLKKPVRYDFLDFSTLALREKFCQEEIQINRALGGDTYLGVIPLAVENGVMKVDGKGAVIDWLVKMKRLPEDCMLNNAIKSGSINNENVQRAAEMLCDFYLQSKPEAIDPIRFRQNLLEGIELDTNELLRTEFNLAHAQIIGISSDLLHFIIKHSEMLDARVYKGKVIECHGDLRPGHVCIGTNPVIIDRIEFNRALRIMDVAEELSFLAMECEILGSPLTGQLFMNIYKWKSSDKIADCLVHFYKTKRALLRARLSIQHLLEEKYQTDERKWRTLCNRYLRCAEEQCEVMEVADLST